MIGLQSAAIPADAAQPAEWTDDEIG